MSTSTVRATRRALQSLTARSLRVDVGGADCVVGPDLRFPAVPRPVDGQAIRNAMIEAGVLVEGGDGLAVARPHRDVFALDAFAHECAAREIHATAPPWKSRGLAHGSAARPQLRAALARLLDRDARRGPPRAA
jgi:hypothetical protein